MNHILNSALLAAAACLLPSLSFAADANPMDEAGVLHNAYLSCLQSNSPSKVDSLTRLVERCGYDPHMPLDEFVATYKPLVEQDPTLLVSEKMAPQRKRFSDYEFSFYERIDEIVMSAADQRQADAMLAALESEAIAKLDARTSTGANILGTLSVARHSLAYWSVYGGTGGGTTGKMRWWKWLLVAAADAAGYAVTENVGTAASASNWAYGQLNTP